MTKAQTVEIFSSVQGEGKYAGVKQIFVRFYKCNMHCSWCDTPHSIGDKKQSHDIMSLEELQSEIEKLWNYTHSISLTGGEPLLQADFIKTLVLHPQNEERSFHLETNGTLPEELEKIIDYIDVVAMDIKMPSSTKDRSFWDEHEEFLEIALRKETFVKVVVSKDTVKEDIEKTVSLLSMIQPDIFFVLQPNSFELKNGVVNDCLEYADYCSKYLTNVRVLPQMHKFIKVP